MKYRVDLGINTWKNGRKTHIMGKSRGGVPVQVRGVPVHLVFCFPVSTSFLILAITFSFRIQFE